MNNMDVSKRIAQFLRFFFFFSTNAYSYLRSIIAHRFWLFCIYIQLLGNGLFWVLLYFFSVFVPAVSAVILYKMGIVTSPQIAKEERFIPISFRLFHWEC